MTPSPIARRLVDLAEEELGLVATGRYDELADLHGRRAVVLEQLPTGLPSEADRPLLERALALQTQVARQLEVARDATARELMRLAHGRRAARGYAASTGRH